jgi:hypothetical protein
VLVVVVVVAEQFMVLILVGALGQTLRLTATHIMAVVVVALGATVETLVVRRVKWPLVLIITTPQALLLMVGGPVAVVGVLECP